MVTVIIPSYNHAQFIKQRIDSVLAQTYQDFEVIILEDCSQDSSLEIVKAYESHPKVRKIISNIENSGSVFKQWKKGIELANGKYTWIAESDDFTDETFLETLVKILEDDLSLGFAYCNSWIVDENNNRDSEFPTYTDKRNFVLKQKWSNSFKSEGNDFLKKYLGLHCYVNNASAVLFRTEFLKTISFNLSEYKFAGDWAVYIDIAKRANVYYLHKNLSFYRDHFANASKKGNFNNQLLIESFKNSGMYYNYLLENNSNPDSFLKDVGNQFTMQLLFAKNKLNLYKTLKNSNKIFFNKIIKRIFPTITKIVLNKFLIKKH